MALLPLTLNWLLATTPLQTEAEQSQFQRTGRYAEVERLCQTFAATYPRHVRCHRFGTTPEGRPELALIVSKKGTLTPSAARRAGLPVVFFQGGIHAGEIEGKDAGFWTLRELLEEKGPEAKLEKLVVVFVPVFNVDGHERFGPNHRPNQRGPAEMGWRTTAQNLNLNRDYTKVDAPEMAAMLELLGSWDPILHLDLHATDGAKFEHDVAVLLEPLFSGDAALRALGRQTRDAVLAELTAQGHLPLPFYPSFEEEDVPESGFAAGVAPPRFSQGYWSLRNRFGVLVETHSWRTYAHRVKATRNVLHAFLEQAALHGRAWRKAAQAADARDAEGQEPTVVLAFKPGPKVENFPFRGVAYKKVASDISGKTWIVYDETQPQVWQVPLRPEPLPALEVPAPKGGYLIPRAYTPGLRERLAHHGFEVQVLPEGRTVDALTFRARSKKFATAPFEGRLGVTLDGEWKAERRYVAPGSLYVPAQQPGRRLLVHLFEPKARDSFVSWGFFNAAFEQKEYIEDYVLEQSAREMLQANPALASQFAQALEVADGGSPPDPTQRLRFFAERHPAWDAQLDLYPVLRLEHAP